MLRRVSSIRERPANAAILNLFSYTFRFAPVVYRHWYTNPSGDEAPLFVMTYAAER